MSRLKVSKIGLLNFWLYDEEEFDFYGGNLILRGTNGSGKSVTMQSFIPLILDGNKSPDRLDPFGSKERKIEDYILGDSESIQKEESTAYLYMEVFQKEENKYITVGLGFRGRKGKPTESWGFALKDGKRIGKDFFLYKDASNKIPLSKNELKSRLGTINEFTDTTRDYKAMVNRLLFGFPNLDMYDEFIKLLLQLRSNKLSKDYKPTNLIQVLNTVLQPLTEEDLRPLSEAIEQMNKTKEQVETLERNSKSLKDFLKVYNNYNELILFIKAKNYHRASIDYQEIQKKLENLTKSLQEVQINLENKKQRQVKVIEEIAVNTENKRQLDNQDLKQKIEQLNELQKEVAELETKLIELERKIEEKEKERIDFSTKLNNTESDIYKLQKDIMSSSTDIKDLANDCYFEELTYFIDELKEQFDEEVSFDSVFMSLKSYLEKVNHIIKLLEKEQQILLDSENTRVEFERLVTEYNCLEQDLNNQERNLKEGILAWQEDFINKELNNKYLKLDDLLKKQIFEFLNDYSPEQYLKAKDVYLNAAREIENGMIETALKLENKRAQKQTELSILKVEYKEVEEKDTIELSSSSEETDRLLEENHIENVPLYKCIEFRKEVGESVRNSIEASLLEFNILNAKILSQKDIEQVRKWNSQILYLTKSTKKKDNIAKYFDIKLPENCTLSKTYIQEILESISTTQEDMITIGEDGTSKIDILNFVASSTYQQTYIGYLKRLELKKQKLEELEKQIENITKEITNIEHLIGEIQRQQQNLKMESESFPSNETLNQIERQIHELKSEISYNDKRQKELEKTLGEYDNKVKEIKNQIQEQKRGLSIPLNLVSYKEAATSLQSIKELLQELKNTHQQYLNKIEMKMSIQEMLTSTIQNIDYMKIDREDKTTTKNIRASAIMAIEELLETKEYKNQKERLLQIEQNLSNLSSEKDKLVGEIARTEENIEHQTKELETLQESEKSIVRKYQIYQEIFLREYKLGYIYQDEVENINQTAKNIIKIGSTRKETTLSDALSNFYTSFNRYHLDLGDYSLNTITLFNDYNATDEEEKKIYEDAERTDVTAMYQGVRLNVIELSKRLENDIEENKYLISKQDRHLFEDILLNTVGDKIRKRIDASNEWVAKINNIMSQMQENSALGFKLVWKSVAADNEGEVDTKELVRILKMDPKLLKDSDRDKLTNHFRSKIKKAEELYQDSYISFYKIIEEVLDYRNWFTFQLLYQRKGMNLKELTDKTFSKFSGGERAKSMYIPLFASCYAKLNLAKEFALRIIALDEAFAGVDEENIREMFGILKYLDIDFVINSQVLWGDYDTIDDLSICELIRPQNSQVVTVERYHWNGKYKEIINDRKEYNEELDNA